MTKNVMDLLNNFDDNGNAVNNETDVEEQQVDLTEGDEYPVEEDFVDEGVEEETDVGYDESEEGDELPYEEEDGDDSEDEDVEWEVDDDEEDDEIPLEDEDEDEEEDQ